MKHLKIDDASGSRWVDLSSPNSMEGTDCYFGFEKSIEIPYGTQFFNGRMPLWEMKGCPQLGDDINLLLEEEIIRE